MKEDRTGQKIAWIQGFMDNPVIWWVLTVGLFTITVVAVFLTPIHHDVGWFLYTSGRLVEGAKLYRDILDVKPPLIFYWYVPPVWIGHALKLNEIAFFKTYVLLAVVLSLATCRRVLNYSLQSSPAIWRRCLLLILLLVFLPSYNFGQSEHIMLILVMPYILVAVGRAEGRVISRRLVLLVGGLAGLGLAQKPHFLFLWLMIEMYLTLISGKGLSWRRPENVGIVIVLTLYGLFILLGTPDYYRKMLPITMQMYGAFNCDIYYLLKNSVTKLWVLVFVAFLVIHPLADNREIRRILFLASTSFLIIALIQRKGFHYHFYPAKATLVLLLVVIVFDSSERIQVLRKLLLSGKSAAVGLIILGLFLVSGVRAVRLLQSTEDPLLSPLIRIAQEHAKGKPIFVLSSSSFPAFPLVNYSGARWSSRFNCLWLLPGLYSDASVAENAFPYHSMEERGPVEDFFVDAIIADMFKNPPVLLIVDCSPVKQGFGKTEFDYTEYFLQDPRFAEFWPKYELLAVVEQYGVFKRSGDLKCGLLRSTEWILRKDQIILERA